MNRRKTGWLVCRMRLAHASVSIMLWAACATDVPQRASTEARAARAAGIEIPLIARAGGETYLLANAVFEIAGPTGVTIGGDTSGTQELVSVRVAPGDYTVRLEPGWQLQRETALGFRAVNAELLSDVLQRVSVEEGEFERVRNRFETDGKVLETGHARIGVGIEVVVAEDDCAADAQCDDANRCTQDRCVSATCEHTGDTADGLIAWWPGDDDTNEIVGGHHGTADATLGFARGVAGAAFSFETSSAAVLVPASPALQALSLTIEAWIYPTELSMERPILEFAPEAGAAGVHFWINTLPEGGGTNSGTLFANLRDVDGLVHHVGSGPGVVTAFAWQHVAVTYDQPNGNASLYVNGRSLLSRNIGSFTPQMNYPVHLGRRPEMSTDGSAGTRFAGRLDEVGLWNRALSAAEIRALYDGGATAKCE